jgi:hypothetical protein
LAAPRRMSLSSANLPRISWFETAQVRLLTMRTDRCGYETKTAPANAGAVFSLDIVISADDLAEIGAAFLRQHDHLGADIHA